MFQRPLLLPFALALTQHWLSEFAKVDAAANFANVDDAMTAMKAARVKCAKSNANAEAFESLCAPAFFDCIFKAADIGTLGDFGILLAKLANKPGAAVGDKPTGSMPNLEMTDNFRRLSCHRVTYYIFLGSHSDGPIANLQRKVGGYCAWFEAVEPDKKARETLTIKKAIAKHTGMLIPADKKQETDFEGFFDWIDRTNWPEVLPEHFKKLYHTNRVACVDENMSKTVKEFMCPVKHFPKNKEPLLETCMTEKQNGLIPTNILLRSLGTGYEAMVKASKIAEVYTKYRDACAKNLRNYCEKVKNKRRQDETIAQQIKGNVYEGSQDAEGYVDKIDSWIDRTNLPVKV